MALRIETSTYEKPDNGPGGWYIELEGTSRMEVMSSAADHLLIAEARANGFDPYGAGAEGPVRQVGPFNYQRVVQFFQRLRDADQTDAQPVDRTSRTIQVTIGDHEWEEIGYDGEGEAAHVRLYGPTLCINGRAMHLFAYEATDAGGVQKLAHPCLDEVDAALGTLNAGYLDTTLIRGRRYVLAAVPHAT